MHVYLCAVCICVTQTSPLQCAARFVISSHTLMSQVCRIGPISLSNLVNLAILLSPRGFQLLTVSHSMGALNRAGGGGGGGVVVGGGGKSGVGGWGSYRAVRYHNGALQLGKLPMRRSQLHRRSDRVSFSCDRSICAASGGPLSRSLSHRHYRLIAGIADTPGEQRLSVMRSSVVIAVYHHRSSPPSDMAKCRRIDSQASFTSNGKA